MPEEFDRGAADMKYIQAVEQKAGALYILSAPAYKYSHAVEMRLRSWLSVDRLLVDDAGINHAIRAQLLMDPELRGLWVACFPPNIAALLAVDEDGLATILASIEVEYLGRHMNSRTKYFVQDINDELRDMMVRL
jgi:hypothetical protein